MPPRIASAAVCRSPRGFLVASTCPRQPLLPSARVFRSIHTSRPHANQSPSPASTPRSLHTSSDGDSSSTFTTVSPDEVSHFNALASSWWDPHGPSRILHLMNPLRHDFIRSIRASVGDNYPAAAADPSSSSSTTPTNSRQHPKQGLKYLDIGCGGGIFAESAARLPTTHSVTAIDPTPQVLAIAQAHARRDPVLSPATSPGRLNYINTSIEHLPVPEAPDQAYDIVSVFEVLEHVNQPAEFLDRCTPFVKPGGWLVMSTIARTWMSWFTTNFMAEDVLRIVPKGTHDWNKYINEYELRQHFAEPAAGAADAAAGTEANAAGVVTGDGARATWEAPRCMGVIYVPGVGWREVAGSEKVGNYFFAVRRSIA